jgi:hypothetical protein
MAAANFQKDMRLIPTGSSSTTGLPMHSMHDTQRTRRQS